MAKIKVVVFDFDGTICDSFQFVIQILNQYSRKIGYRGLKKNELMLLRDMTLKEIIQQMRLSFFQLPFLAYWVRKELGKGVDSLSPFPDINYVIEYLHKQNIQVGILTSNTKGNVVRFLQNHGLVVDFIYAKSSLFGKHHTLKRMMLELKLHPQQILHVGDEVRDIEASKKVGVKVAAVTWGFNSEKVLRKYSPDYLITRPSELLEKL